VDSAGRATTVGDHGRLRSQPTSICSGYDDMAGAVSVKGELTA
jgi:hypothetical protein